MKKLILPLSLVLLGFTTIATTASAQRYDAEVRYEGEQRFEGEERYEGRRGRAQIVVQRGRDGRLGYDLERLNRQLRIVRGDLRAYGAGRRIRAEYYQIARETERLNYQFRRAPRRGWEMRRRVEQLRSDLFRLQQEVRSRRGGLRILR